jgi:transposase-like protein
MRRCYEKAFRNDAAKLAIPGGRTISETAKDLGVKETIMYNWISKAGGSKIPYMDDDKIRSAADIIDELKQLKKENVRLMEECGV